MTDERSKLPQVGTTIFTVMSKMAADHQAINLSQGFPDFPVSEDLIERINFHMRNGKNQYAPMSGTVELRHQISRITKLRYGYNADPETQITVTAGATEALFASISALVHAGDEVIVFDPAYDSYDPAIQLAGGIPVHIALSSDFSIPWDIVYSKLSSATRMIIINSPHNPSGSVLSEDDMLELEKITSERNIYVLSDEVYEHIIFDRSQHESALRFQKLSKNSIVISSFGKTFHATGWKVGYVIAPAEIMAEIKKVHQYLTFSVHTPTQLALADFLSEDSNYTNVPALYEAKRNFFLSAISDSRFEARQCSGTYFQLMSYEKINDYDDIKMAEWLTKEHGVASIPISVFYQGETNQKLLRFCFAKENDTLERAAEVLCKI